MRTSASPHSSATRSARRVRQLLGVLAAGSLLLAACGDDGDDDATTTSEDGSDATTTTADEEAPAEIAAEDLEALLPDASDIGAGFRIAEEEDDDEEDDSGLDVESAMEEACPALAELTSDDDEDDDDVEREFEDQQGRSVTVSFDPSPRSFDDEKFTETVDAMNSCGTIELETEQFTMTMELSAEPDDSVGDIGVRVTMEALAASAELPRPIEITMTAHMFLVGSVSGSVEVVSGLDPQTLEPVKGEVALLDTLPQEMEQALRDLGA